MDALDALKLRRSIRDYQDKLIPEEVLEKIVDVARFAPTARNVQPWEFVLVTKSQTLKKIGDLAETGRFISSANACIAVFCAETKYYLEDGCAATVNILNAATAFGIGSCWVAGDKKPYSGQIAELLGVPAGFKLVSLVALGYPEDRDGFKLSDKRSLKDVMHWEEF